MKSIRELRKYPKRNSCVGIVYWPLVIKRKFFALPCAPGLMRLVNCSTPKNWNQADRDKISISVIMNNIDEDLLRSRLQSIYNQVRILLKDQSHLPQSTLEAMAFISAESKDALDG